MLVFSKVIVFSLVFFLFSFSKLISAQSATESLVEVLEEMTSLEGRFIQQTYAIEGEQLNTSSGIFKVKRPYFFYWHVLTPGENLLVSDGSQVWDYDVDLEQVIQTKIESDKLYNSPMHIISGGIESISRHYQIELDDSPNNFILIPKELGSGFTRLSLTFENRVLTKMEMTDAFAQRTEILLVTTKLNPSLESDMFKLKVPEGIDIIFNGIGYGDINMDRSRDD